MIHSSLMPLHDYASPLEKLLSTCPLYSPLEMGRRRAKEKTRPNKHTLHTISKAEYISVIRTH